MSLGVCCLICFGFYKLGSYNAKFPGQAWANCRQAAEWLRQWLKGSGDVGG
jgi:hypothetical protein